MVLLNV